MTPGAFCVRLRLSLSSLASGRSLAARISIERASTGWLPGGRKRSAKSGLAVSTSTSQPCVSADGGTSNATGLVVRIEQHQQRRRTLGGRLAGLGLAAIEPQADAAGIPSSHCSAVCSPPAGLSQVTMVPSRQLARRSSGCGLAQRDRPAHELDQRLGLPGRAPNGPS